jgi:hydroxymethylglutaryl-CoA lyase
MQNVVEQASAPKIKLIECPRDAMQGWKQFIPAEKKAEYINALIKVGFDTIDFGSFVSPKSIPQMADTKAVIRMLQPGENSSKLLAIVANTRGAEEAVQYDGITYLGFPFSVSSTFQMRNTNSSPEESLKNVGIIRNLCAKNKKELVVYLSMGFGNPFGDAYNTDIVMQWTDKLIGLEIKILSIADTVGLAEASQIKSLLDILIPQYPYTEIGVHLHSSSSNWKLKINAALKAGCKRFDGALKGIGGCPMANDNLVGNMDTELMIPYFEQLSILPELDKEALSKALILANEIFK